MRKDQNSFILIHVLHIDRDIVFPFSQEMQQNKFFIWWEIKNLQLTWTEYIKYV